MDFNFGINPVTQNFMREQQMRQFSHEHAMQFQKDFDDKFFSGMQRQYDFRLGLMGSLIKAGISL